MSDGRFILFHVKRHPSTMSGEEVKLLGHKDDSTTMIYCHVLNRGGLGIHSPADLL